MSKKSFSRSEAFAVVEQALDLAQNLSEEFETRNPQFLRLSWKLSRKRLFRALRDKHQVIRYATEDAYDLVDVLSKWAAQLPVEVTDLLDAPGEHCAKCSGSKCAACACSNTRCCEA